MNKETYLHCFWFVVSYGWKMFYEMHSFEYVKTFFNAYEDADCLDWDVAHIYISDYACNTSHNRCEDYEFICAIKHLLQK